MKWGGTSLACGGEESPSTRREWIEIQLLALYQQLEESPSTRREWIEIKNSPIYQKRESRLPPHGGSGLKFHGSAVCRSSAESPSTRREWIEMALEANILASHLSPSTRREWIEMINPTAPSPPQKVSLHTEGVD